MAKKVNLQQRLQGFSVSQSADPSKVRAFLTSTARTSELARRLAKVPVVTDAIDLAAFDQPALVG